MSCPALDSVVYRSDWLNPAFSPCHSSHRLLLSGVADQLQTNYASDLRSILKTLFEVMATKPETDDKEKLKKGECCCRTGSEVLTRHCVHCPQEGSMQKLTPQDLLDPVCQVVDLGR